MLNDRGTKWSELRIINNLLLGFLGLSSKNNYDE